MWEEPIFIPHENCHYFYVCTNGRKAINNCKDMAFNPKLGVCDWAGPLGCTDPINLESEEDER